MANISWAVLAGVQTLDIGQSSGGGGKRVSPGMAFAWKCFHGSKGFLKTIKLRRVERESCCGRLAIIGPLAHTQQGSLPFPRHEKV